MAGRRVWVNDSTGQVDSITTSSLSVRRDGDFFVFVLGETIKGRDRNIRVALKPMRRKPLKSNIIRAFLAQDPPLSDLRQTFRGYKIAHGRPQVKEEGVVHG